MNQTETLRLVHAEVKRRLAGLGAGHGLDHVERVLLSARQINSEVGADAFVIELAALLHDVGDAKFHNGVERSGELSEGILRDLGVDQGVIDHVVQIVENISFRKRASAESLSLEGQVVQDADRLDALGAVGIVRTIEYGAFADQPFFLPDSPEAKTGVGHFYQKLFKLRDLMNTEAARRIAADREQFMRFFLNQFYHECGHTKQAAADHSVG